MDHERELGFITARGSPGAVKDAYKCFALAALTAQGTRVLSPEINPDTRS